MQKSHSQDEFERLTRQAAGCTTCPSMIQQSAVLGPGNGSIDSEILFVAEAPGRFGGARTGIPFSGDKSGDNFETLIAHIGLTRNDIFVTNAVLCNPLANGNNRRPTTKEIGNCSHYLQTVLELMRPRVVVTLGGVGLEAINRILGTRYKLAEVIGKPQRSERFTLLPLYHPSPRVTNWKRPLSVQKRDFKKILKIVQSTV
ncbi:MAG: uracil-DNA glycosylase [Nitrospinae bacterium]|nr:uracil-DNA glycosylase [Nitrospinota bacterium]